MRNSSFTIQESNFSNNRVTAPAASGGAVKVAFGSHHYCGYINGSSALLKYPTTVSGVHYQVSGNFVGNRAICNRIGSAYYARGGAINIDYSGGKYTAP